MRAHDRSEREVGRELAVFAERQYGLQLHFGHGVCGERQELRHEFGAAGLIGFEETFAETNRRGSHHRVGVG